jgi:hypothetical protein
MQTSGHATQGFPLPERRICRWHEVTTRRIEDLSRALPARRMIATRIRERGGQFAVRGSNATQSGGRPDMIRRVPHPRTAALADPDSALPELPGRIGQPGIEIPGAIKAVATRQQINCSQQQRIPHHWRAPP